MCATYTALIRCKIALLIVQHKLSSFPAEISHSQLIGYLHVYGMTSMYMDGCLIPPVTMTVEQTLAYCNVIN